MSALSTARSARSLTSDASRPPGPEDPVVRTASATPPSRSAPSSARGVFHRQVLPALLSHRRKPATVPEGYWPPGPASGASLLFACAWRGWTGHGIRGCSPRRWAGQAPPVDFCNHHGSPARPRTDPPPRGRQEITPCAADAGSHASCGAGPAERSLGQGPPRTGYPRQHLPMRLLAGKLCPDPMGSGTSCHEVAPASAGEDRAQGSGTRFPRIRRRPARNAPAASGLASDVHPRRRA